MTTRPLPFHRARFAICRWAAAARLCTLLVVPALALAAGDPPDPGNLGTGGGESLLAFSRPSFAPPRQTPGVPSDEELEASGAVIGQIVFDNQNIFDLSNPKDDTKLFRLANRLHERTRARTIRDQLLFRPGQRYSRRLLDESERILRANGYFYDAWIRTTSYHDGKVDLRVTTKDVWTLNPGFNFSRSGGKSQTGVQIEEINTLGTGTDVKLEHTNSVDRTESDIMVTNPHTFGTWFTTSIDYGSLSDGKTRLFILDRPFYALETKHAGGITLNDSTQDNALYDRGQEIDKFANHGRFYQIYGGFSRGCISPCRSRETNP